MFRFSLHKELFIMAQIAIMNQAQLQILDLLSFYTS